MSCDVSVVIPVYNSSGTLARALDSVYRQSLPPREIIVVDDGSADWEESRRIAAAGPAAISAQFIRLKTNQGPSWARNAGIEAALGRYLAFLDADDIWYEDKIAIQYEVMTVHNLDFSMHRYCDDLTRERADGTYDGQPPWPLAPLSSWTPLLRNDSTNSVMVLREKMIRYDTALRRGEDFALYMELLSRPGCRALYIRRALAGGFKSTIGASGLSGDVKAMHEGRMLALKKLWDRGCMNRAQYLFGISTETLKYPLRTLRVALRSRAAMPPPARTPGRCRQKVPPEGADKK
jgi:glycosyltransferase involved in cell wall biosynthesis